MECKNHVIGSNSEEEENLNLGLPQQNVLEFRWPQSVPITVTETSIFIRHFSTCCDRY